MKHFLTDSNNENLRQTSFLSESTKYLLKLHCFRICTTKKISERPQLAKATAACHSILLRMCDPFHLGCVSDLHTCVMRAVRDMCEKPRHCTYLHTATPRRAPTDSGPGASNVTNVRHESLNRPPVRDGVLRLSVVTVFRPQLLRPQLCFIITHFNCRICLLYTSPSPRDLSTSRMPSSA